MLLLSVLLSTHSSRSTQGVVCSTALTACALTLHAMHHTAMYWQRETSGHSLVYACPVASILWAAEQLHIQRVLPAGVPYMRPQPLRTLQQPACCFVLNDHLHHAGVNMGVSCVSALQKPPGRMTCGAHKLLLATPDSKNHVEQLLNVECCFSLRTRHPASYLVCWLLHQHRQSLRGAHVIQ